MTAPNACPPADVSAWEDGLFGVSRMWVEAERAQIAEIVEAIDDAAQATPLPDDEPDGRRSLGRRRFDGLTHLATTHMAGGPHTPRPARATVNLIVDHHNPPTDPAATTDADGADGATHGVEAAPQGDAATTDTGVNGVGMPRWDGYGPPRLLDRALGPVRLTHRGLEY